jgi:hypothetical protein
MSFRRWRGNPLRGRQLRFLNKRNQAHGAFLRI